jgi:arylsulfatase A-like enzyme
MGAESLEIYEGRSASTPRLTEMALRGRRYERFYSNPSCTPSRATLLSGRYPFRTGMIKNGPNRDMADADCIFGEAMKAAGYVTAVVGKLLPAVPGGPVTPTGILWLPQASGR